MPDDARKEFKGSGIFEKAVHREMTPVGSTIVWVDRKFNTIHSSFPLYRQNFF
jgi:hypothetical protein